MKPSLLVGAEGPVLTPYWLTSFPWLSFPFTRESRLSLLCVLTDPAGGVGQEV